MWSCEGGHTNAGSNESTVGRISGSSGIGNIQQNDRLAHLNRGIVAMEESLEEKRRIRKKLV